jgi:FKBP-type peptidyl-prolyl cis-trans isomerase SlyD
MTLLVDMNHAVTVRYDMKTHLPDGSVTERHDEAIEFIYGVENQVPSLEKALLGAAVGDRFSLRIPPTELYGERDPNLIREIPKGGLLKQRIQEGRYYRQIRKGCLVSFKILQVNPETVLADFNGPMAGISVSLDMEVTAIREAGQKEIEEAFEANIKKSIGCG